jgi:hypothetical protein
MKFWKCLLILIPCLLSAQINTEKLRNDKEKGFSGNVSLGYGMVMGNTEYLNFIPTIRLDYNTDNYINFISASYNRKQSKLNKDKKNLLEHKGFAHIRSARIITPFLSWEEFGQWEFNEFINLKNRLLIGTGARMDLLSSKGNLPVSLILGVGGMYEEEDYNQGNDKKLLRSTNYLTFIWNISGSVLVQTTSYYQFAVEELEDYRIISESGLKFDLSSWLIFGTNVALRYDNDPTEGVKKKYDMELNNNLTVSF